MKKLVVAIASTAVVTALGTYGAARYRFERPVLDANVVQGTLQSARLRERRSFLVHLPESYRREPARRYPVLYVLDGSSQDLHTAASAALLARIGLIPEVLTVGIPNVSGRGRQRDYTPPDMRQDTDKDDRSLGRADAFQAFLKDELLPRIEADYRTSGPRLLAGHSRGGLFVLYSLMTEPSLFDGRFAYSPALWRDQDAAVAHLDRFLASAPPLRGFLFLSLGDRENPKMAEAFHRTLAVLRARAPQSLHWRAEITSGADHHSNPVLSTPVGLFGMLGSAPPAPASSPASP